MRKMSGMGNRYSFYGRIGILVGLCYGAAIIFCFSLNNENTVVKSLQRGKDIDIHEFRGMACIGGFCLRTALMSRFIISVKEVLIYMEGIKNHIFNKQVIDVFSGYHNVINQSSRKQEFPGNI